MTPHDLPADFEEAAALWAAGGLSAEAHSQLLARAESDPSLAAELHSMDGVLEALFECADPSPPPARIKSDLLKRIGSRAPKIAVRRAEAARWETTSNPAISRRLLGVDRHRGTCTIIMRMAPGGVLAGHIHAGAEECLVLSGDLRSNDQILGPGDYFFAEPGSEHQDLTTVSGCECLLISAIGD